MTSDEVYKLIEANGLTLHGDIEHFAELVAQHQREKDREQAVALLRQLHDSFSLESAELRIGKWAAQYEEKYKYGTPLLDAFTKEKP